MRHKSRFFILILLGFLAIGSLVWAQDETFESTPSPTPDFLSDRSYDNTDIDGTPLDPKKTPTPDDTKNKKGNDNDQNNSNSESRDTDPL